MRGPDRDGKVAGFVAPETWPEELSLKWRVFEGAGDATPALVGERFYVFVFARQGADEVILWLNAGAESRAALSRTSMRASVDSRRDAA